MVSGACPLAKVVTKIDFCKVLVGVPGNQELCTVLLSLEMLPTR